MKNIKDYISESKLKYGWTWETECNKDGKIETSITKFSEGGRETNTAEFELEKLSDLDDCYLVKATCIKSNYPGIKKGYELEFELYKDSEVWDIASMLQDAIEKDK